MRTNSRFAIDANVIVRYVMRDDHVLVPKARAIIEGVEDSLLTVVCDPVTLSEVVHVLKSYYKLPREDIYGGLEPIVKLEGLLTRDKPKYIRALELFSDSIPHFGDACACAAALEDCEGRLLSFDKDLSKVEGVFRAESVEAA